ncbi:hypothetical protein ACRRTK_013538 [Alexandromys fortis]
MEARGLRMPLLLLLVAVVVLAKVNHVQRWGGFKEKASSKKNMNSTLHFFIQSYNNASNDTYLFRVQKLIQSQMQLSTGVEYLVTVKIGRTKCKKSEASNVSCPLQSSKLKKTYPLEYASPFPHVHAVACSDVELRGAMKITVLGATLGKS